MTKNKYNYNKCHRCKQIHYTAKYREGLRHYYCDKCRIDLEKYKDKKCLIALIKHQEDDKKTDFKLMTKDELVRKCVSLHSNRVKTCDTIIKLRLEVKYLKTRLINCDYNYRQMLINDGVDINEYIR